jgi:hypothetical protein
MLKGKAEESQKIFWQNLRLKNTSNTKLQTVLYAMLFLLTRENHTKQSIQCQNLTNSLLSQNIKYNDFKRPSDNTLKAKYFVRL